MRRPRLTKKVVKGLSEVTALVSADVQGEKFPEEVYTAIRYLDDLIYWYNNKKPQDD